jgi:hypothetical protein
MSGRTSPGRSFIFGELSDTIWRMKLCWPALAAFLALSACGPLVIAPPTPTFTPPPTPPVIASPIPVSNAEGTPIAEQPGFLEWVLVSGVDEHGLTAEHFLALLAEPEAGAPVAAETHTGSPVSVLEIRHVGPQGLQRFYHVETLEGVRGWISDYYIRRQAYVFNFDGTSVPVFENPGGDQIAELANVTPVTLRGPQGFDWWLVGSLDGSVVGWVAARFVKESPEESCLLGEDQPNICDTCPYLFP